MAVTTLRAGRGEVPVHRRHRPRGDRRRLPAASLLGGRRPRDREHVRGRARGGARSEALRAGGRRVYQPHGFVDDEPPAELPAGRRLGRNRARRLARGIETTRLARKIAAALRRGRERRVRRKGAALRPGHRPAAAADGRVDCSTEDDPAGGLGATTNVQGQFAAGLTPPRDFVSVEASERVRNRRRRARRPLPDDRRCRRAPLTRLRRRERVPRTQPSQSFPPRVK